MRDPAQLPVASAAPSTTAKLLRTRAQLLARPPQYAAVANTMLEVLQFRLGQERCAVETRYVREVSPLKDLTPLPCTPPFVLGIINVRGGILPVLDLRKFFDLPEQGLADLHHVIVASGHGIEIGLVTDLALDVRTIPVASLQRSLPTLTGVRADYLKGVTAERLVVLDLARILADPNIIVHEEVDS